MAGLTGGSESLLGPAKMACAGGSPGGIILSGLGQQNKSDATRRLPNHGFTNGKEGYHGPSSWRLPPTFLFYPTSFSISLFLFPFPMCLRNVCVLFYSISFSNMITSEFTWDGFKKHNIIYLKPNCTTKNIQKNLEFTMNTSMVRRFSHAPA